MPVHFAGYPADMDGILSIARRYKLVVIEDAAHALGSTYKGTSIGGLQSTVTEFSFHPVKSITTGEGGILVTNNKKYTSFLQLLRTHGVAKNAKGWNVMTELGFNYRMTDFQAALGTSQLRRLKTFVQLRHRVVRWYRKYLNNIPHIILPNKEKNTVSAWHIYVIRTTKPTDRDKLYQYLLRKKSALIFIIHQCTGIHTIVVMVTIKHPYPILRFTVKVV